MSQLATRNVGTLGEMLKGCKDRIAEIVNRSITCDQMIRCGLLALNNNPKLQACSAQSFLGCMMTLARVGLEPNTPLQLAYLIPRGNECTVLVGYRGYLALMYRSRLVECVDSFIVYAGDEFHMHYGSKPYIYHRPVLDASREDKDIVGAYATCLMKGARRPLFCYMTRAELMKSAKVGGMNGPAYKDWMSEMFRKAPVRRGAKMWPLTSEVGEAIAIAAEAEDDGKFVDTVGEQPALPKQRPAIQGVIDELPAGSDDGEQFAAEAAALMEADRKK